MQWLKIEHKDNEHLHLAEKASEYIFYNKCASDSTVEQVPIENGLEKAAAGGLSN